MAFYATSLLPRAARRLDKYAITHPRGQAPSAKPDPPDFPHSVRTLTGKFRIGGAVRVRGLNQTSGAAKRRYRSSKARMSGQISVRINLVATLLQSTLVWPSLRSGRCTSSLWTELSTSKSMVFISGPRQAGKTTLAKAVPTGCPASVYFDWDVREDRARLLRDPSFFTRVDNPGPGPALVILAEIHKYARWKNYLKGVYDAYAGRFHFLVLGSGRLAIYQRGGDSLAGRYFSLSLWPLTIAELADCRRSFAELRKVPGGGLRHLRPS
jgi:hypothetical protein